MNRHHRANLLSPWIQLLLCAVLLTGACGHPEGTVPPAERTWPSSAAAEQAATVLHSPWPAATPDGATIVGSKDTRLRLADAPARVIAVIAARDFAALAAWVHPEDGLRLSPYAYVEKQKQVRLGADAIRAASESDKTYLWGHADGTGDPIELSITEYFDRFVYLADFANAPQVGFDESIGHGNSIDNAREAYPDAAIVEYHFPYLDKNMAGMDWKSLRLVFRQYAGDWYLCGIIRDVWTI